MDAPRRDQFKSVRDSLNKLPGGQTEKISAHLKILATGQREKIETKTLRGPIKELIVRQFRIIFFQIGASIYVVDLFKKQTRKTPRRVIEKAESIYSKITVDQK